MPVYVLDLVVIGVVLISALLAVVRGFTREVLAIVAWVAAAAAALFLHPDRPALSSQQYINNTTVALVAAIGAHLPRDADHRLVHHGADLGHDPRFSRIGALDRTLGFVFGAARGLPDLRDRLAVLGLARCQGKQPDWAAQRRRPGRMLKAPATS